MGIISDASFSGIIPMVKNIWSIGLKDWWGCEKRVNLFFCRVAFPPCVHQIVFLKGAERQFNWVSGWGVGGFIEKREEDLVGIPTHNCSNFCVVITCKRCERENVGCLLGA